MMSKKKKSDVWRLLIYFRLFMLCWRKAPIHYLMLFNNVVKKEDIKKRQRIIPYLKIYVSDTGIHARLCLLR